MSPSVIPGLEAAWVLIFNARQDNEGVYTLEGEHSPAAVLAFEHADDADRFAQSLATEGFDLATLSRWHAEQLTAFCVSGGYGVELVPAGTLRMPPKTNEYHTNNSPQQPYQGPRPDNGDYLGRQDPHNAYRMQLEALLPQNPDNCGDDDCTPPDY